MNSYYSFQQINPQYYRILANGDHCCELVIGKEKAALIDTGLGLGNFRAAVDELVHVPLIILNTHSHIDHAGGNSLVDAPAYMGAEDIATYDYSSGRDNRLNTLRRHAHEMPQLQAEGFDPDDYAVPKECTLIPCQEGDAFDLGGVTFEVYNTPGHSAGGRSYYWKEYHYLFTGDAVYPRSLVFGYGSADRTAHIATVRKLMKIPFDRIYGTHLDRFMTHRDLDLFLKAALEVRYEDGVPFPNPIRNGQDARTCCLPGFSPEDEQKEGFAGLVLSSYNA